MVMRHDPLHASAPNQTFPAVSVTAPFSLMANHGANSCPVKPRRLSSTVSAADTGRVCNWSSPPQRPLRYCSEYVLDLGRFHEPACISSTTSGECVLLVTSAERLRMPVCPSIL